MDIWKVLSETRIIDIDPASDVERDEGLTVKKEGNITINPSKNKKNKKAVSVMSKMASDDLTIDYIISETPPKKKVIQFIKNRIQELLDEDD
jgi:hypothetical protein